MGRPQVSLEWGCSGGVLLSHTLAGVVPWALVGLASGFGMGPGVSPPLWPPEQWPLFFSCCLCCFVGWGGVCGGSCIVDAVWCVGEVFGLLVPVD